jgi:hypothetical protein
VVLVLVVRFVFVSHFVLSTIILQSSDLSFFWAHLSFHFSILCLKSLFLIVCSDCYGQCSLFARSRVGRCVDGRDSRHSHVHLHWVTHSVSILFSCLSLFSIFISLFVCYNRVKFRLRRINIYYKLSNASGESPFTRQQERVVRIKSITMSED